MTYPGYIDVELRKIMDDRGLPYEVIDGDKHAPEKILRLLIERGLVTLPVAT